VPQVARAIQLAQEASQTRSNPTTPKRLEPMRRIVI
jgi:hypothetical protein